MNAPGRFDKYPTRVHQIRPGGFIQTIIRWLICCFSQGATAAIIPLRSIRRLFIPVPTLTPDQPLRRAPLFIRRLVAGVPARAIRVTSHAPW
jgi:hypothetical protein